MDPIFQCVLCGHSYEHQPKPKKCTYCGCPMVREVREGRMDSVAPPSISHILKKVENCPNYDVDPRTGTQNFHKLEIEREIDVSGASLKLKPEVAAITVRQRCKHCNELYGQTNIPLSRPDIMQELGILSEVEHRVPGYHGEEALAPAR